VAIAAAVARLLQVLTAGRPTAKEPELKKGHTDVAQINLFTIRFDHNWLVVADG